MRLSRRRIEMVSKIEEDLMTNRVRVSDWEYRRNISYDAEKLIQDSDLGRTLTSMMDPRDYQAQLRRLSEDLVRYITT